MNHSDIIKKHRARLLKIAKKSVSLSADKVADFSPIWSGAFVDSINTNIGSIDESYKSYPHMKIDVSTHEAKYSAAKRRAKSASNGIKMGDTIYTTDSVKHNMVVEYQRGYRPFGLAKNDWQQTVNKAVMLSK